MLDHPCPRQDFSTCRADFQKSSRSWSLDQPGFSPPRFCHPENSCAICWERKWEEKCHVPVWPHLHQPCHTEACHQPDQGDHQKIIRPKESHTHTYTYSNLRCFVPRVAPAQKPSSLFQVSGKHCNINHMFWFTSATASWELRYY